MWASDLIVPSVRIKDAPVAFVAEAPGQGELDRVLQQRAGLDVRVGPLVGPSGWVHDAVCREAGVVRGQCGHYNVLGRRLEGNDTAHVLGPLSVGAPAFVADHPVGRGKWLRPEAWADLERLWAELDEDQPRVIVALGGLAAWALTGNSQVGVMRSAAGVETPRGRVWCTWHPASVRFDGRNKVDMVSDYRAAWEAAHGTVRPVVSVEALVPETVEELRTLLEAHISGRPLVAADIETPFVERPPAWRRWKDDGMATWPPPNDRSGMMVDMVQLCAEAPVAVVVPFHCATRPGGSWWRTTTEFAAAVQLTAQAMGFDMSDAEARAVALEQRRKLAARSDAT